MKTYNVIIIGSGPAGYTAAIYTARANLEPLIICGYTFGGQLTLTDEVENFPGFPEGIKGPQLMENMKKQAMRFGAELIFKDATAVDFTSKPFKIMIEEEERTARSVIIATGASARLLGVPGEKELMGRGVSTCATCDAAFFKGRNVAVIGGGDSALEEALFISRFAEMVYIIHRRDKFRASKILQKRVFENNKIKIIWNTVVVKIIGKNRVEAILIENVSNKQQQEFKIDGVFVAIGHIPNTSIFKGQILLDEQGYIITDSAGKTNIDGVFAAGDVKDHRYRQAITAAASGCIAALEVENYLSTITW
jgi:thioredoxin reductase (NADPH)